MEEPALLCRVCFKEKSLLVNIFEIVEEHQTNLVSLLETHGGLMTDENDSLPKYLCDECTNELLITTKFRMKCTQTNNNFKQLPIADADADGDADGDGGLMKIIPLECAEINSQLPLDDDSIDETLDVIDVVIETSPEKEDIIFDDNFVENRVVRPETTGNITGMSLTELISLPLDNLFKSLSDASHPPDPAPAPTHFKEQSSFICDTCGAYFAKSINLQRHMENFHHQVDFFPCSHCEKIFFKEFNLQEHNCSASIQQENIQFASTEQETIQFKEPKEKNKSKPNLNCSYCGKSFKNAFALEMHIRIHTGERPFVCNYCSKAFKTKSAMKNHKNAHSGFLKYKCSHCEKFFTDSSNLSRHMTVHTGEKPHVCTKCKKSFTRVSLLEHHMRTHTGERPFVCKICQKGFTQLSTLRYHESSHTGEAKYQCSVCEKSYPRRYLLQRHLENIHPDIPLMIEEEVTEGPPMMLDLEGDLNLCLSGYECEVTTNQ